MRQAILTDPLKFWVIIRMRFPVNVMGLRYQTSDTAASTSGSADLLVVFAVVFSVGVSVVVDIVAVAVVVWVSDSGLTVGIEGLGFKSGL